MMMAKKHNIFDDIKKNIVYTEEANERPSNGT